MNPFVAAARRKATSLFQHLDPRFEPKVFLLRLPVEKNDTRRIEYAPADMPFTKEDLNGVINQAHSFRDQDPDSDVFFGPDPIAGWTDAHEKHKQGHHRQVWCRAVHRAVEEAISQAVGNVGFVAFCSWPVARDGMEEVIVLQLQQDAWKSHYHLVKRTRRLSTSDELHTPRSLLDAVAIVFVDEMAARLARNENQRDFGYIIDFAHVINRAGVLLMRMPTSIASNGMAHLNLYDTFCVLSTLRYEGKEGVGRLILSRPNHPSLISVVRLQRPVSLAASAAVRKLLQMGRGKLALLSDGIVVYGLGELKKEYDLRSEDVFTIEFTRQGDWELFHTENRLMHVHFGESSLGPEGFPEALFLTDLPRVMRGIHRDAITPLAKIARAFAEQPHGCLLVISRDAASEAVRLETQCTSVEPFPLTSTVIPLITAIDGAVLVDTHGLCHAIGVILDGPASPMGSRERGARYNSAVRYTAWKANTVAVVKSEDGMVNLFPVLRPQVRHSVVLSRIDALRQLASQNEVDRSEFYDAVKWLEDHAFYLRESECTEVNHLRDAAFNKTPPSSIHIEQKTLSPHTDMDDSYYLPE